MIIMYKSVEYVFNLYKYYNGKFKKINNSLIKAWKHISNVEYSYEIKLEKLLFLLIIQNERDYNYCCQKPAESVILSISFII